MRAAVFFGQAGLAHVVVPCRVDHDRRAAGVHLVAGQVGEVLEHREVDKAGAARPVVFRHRIGDHRHVAQVGQLGHVLAQPVVHVEVLGPAAAPIERGRPGDALVRHVFQQRLDRREAGARGEQDDRLVGLLAQEEAAVGALDAKDVLFLHCAEHVVGELAARHVADVQFEARARRGQGVGRIGHRVAAPRAVAQDELDVLARVELQRLARRQLQAHRHDVVRLLAEREHAHRHLADREGAGFGDLARFEHHVAECAGAAGQHVAGQLFLGAERLALVRAQRDLARELLALAGAAGAVLAAIGQPDALADGGGEDGFVGLGGELAPAGLDGDGKRRDVRPCTHGYSSIRNVMGIGPEFCPQSTIPSARCPRASGASAFWSSVAAMSGCAWCGVCAAVCGSWPSPLPPSG
jgi:hypothetical protein